MISLGLGAGSAYLMDRTTNQKYQHCVPSAKGGGDGERVVLVFRSGRQTVPVVGNDVKATVQTHIDYVSRRGVRHGHIPGVAEMGKYHLNLLQYTGAHAVGVAGINGNQTNGADAIIVNYNDASIGEYDGKMNALSPSYPYCI